MTIDLFDQYIMSKYKNIMIVIIQRNGEQHG